MARNKSEMGCESDEDDEWGLDDEFDWKNKDQDDLGGSPGNRRDRGVRASLPNPRFSTENELKEFLGKGQSGIKERDSLGVNAAVSNNRIDEDKKSERFLRVAERRRFLRVRNHWRELIREHAFEVVAINAQTQLFIVHVGAPYSKITEKLSLAMRKLKSEIKGLVDQNLWVPLVIDASGPVTISSYQNRTISKVKTEQLLKWLDKHGKKLDLHNHSFYIARPIKPDYKIRYRDRVSGQHMVKNLNGVEWGVCFIDESSTVTVNALLPAKPIESRKSSKDLGLKLILENEGTLIYVQTAEKIDFSESRKRKSSLDEW